VRLKGLGQLKNPKTSSRIETATYQFVALHFKYVFVLLYSISQDKVSMLHIVEWLQDYEFRRKWSWLFKTLNNCLETLRIPTWGFTNRKAKVQEHSRSPQRMKLRRLLPRFREGGATGTD
jgi:hypothetical protein